MSTSDDHRAIRVVLGNMDVWSVLGGYLSARDCCNVMICSRDLYNTLKHNTLLWRELYASRYYISACCGLFEFIIHI